jgi:hypothetical protein
MELSPVLFTTVRDSPLHCGEKFRIFRDAADQTLPVTEYSVIYN